ncbi:hypothetical protein L228DRAFT_259155 [Xylona heveae TC161]|uniref:Nicotinamide-nucleotide adenylyltransferase n=1 Tax=Xylona heveae (strain CBS 132557 / TC161) TaxID=1328760 RepID=A0A165J600_XYLHT|nr:hypothetical protein L228DRAFT_259155 [Xylona heveae TC161]KZF25779.1 hypothetical protein L228DRAFT_259155 [Xylona heveae TC161]
MASTPHLPETNSRIDTQHHSGYHPSSDPSAPTASPTTGPQSLIHSPTMPSPQALSNLSNEFRQALSAFAASSSRFQLLRTITSHGEHSFAALISSSTSPHPRIWPTPHTLYILDSSFNPPTRAHRQLALSALRDDERGQEPKRLLLLLATQNADKAPKPAQFQDRLVMMTLFAQDLLRSLTPPSTTSFFDISSPTGSAAPSAATTPSSTAPSLLHNVPDVAIAIDIGITKEPYFVEKSYAITETEVYGPGPTPASSPSATVSPSTAKERSSISSTTIKTTATATAPSSSSSKPPQAQATQVWLTGYDTLTRIMDPKYYLPTHTLAPLEPFLSAHRIRATLRPGDSWGGRAEQEAYLHNLAAGEREHEGGKKEWAQRIELVVGSSHDGGAGDGLTTSPAGAEGDATSSNPVEEKKKECEGAVENQIISSTRVREACQRGDPEALKKLVTNDVADFVLGQGFYKE